MSSTMIITLVAVVLVIVFAASSIRVVREYQRMVAFRLGRLRGALGPGLVFRLPFLDTLIPVDLRVVTLTIPPQEVITRDNVTARVNAVVMFRVEDPVKSVMAVENHAVATSQFAQTTLRSVVGRADLDTLLAHRADLNEDLYESIARQAVPWGVAVSVVEIKDVEIPEMMQRAMARQAEAERERRAKVISAHGELEAAHELRDAAQILSEAPSSLQLRYLQTLLELGADQNSTVVFPLPMDIVGPLMNAVERLGSTTEESRTEQSETHTTKTSNGTTAQPPTKPAPELHGAATSNNHREGQGDE